MRGPVKKLILFSLAALLLVTTPLMAAAEPKAETPQAESMETALLAVRELISIDDDVYTEFSYGSSYSNYQTREGLVWTFNWSDNKNAYIYASVTAEGTLLSYRKYDYTVSTFGFAEISGDDALKIADDFLKKANPDIYTYYDSPNGPTVSINTGEYAVNYCAKVNGYYFGASYINISVNKITGELQSYYSGNLNPKSFTFESAAKTIGKDAAIGAYADKIGLRLEYTSYYDYENGKLKIFPVYMMNSSGDKYISAVTGNVVEYVYDRGSDGEKNAAAPEALSEDSGAGGASRRLTPQEIAAIEKVSGFITSEQALEKLLSLMGLADIDTKAFNDSSVNLSRDYINRDKYIYYISMYTYDGGLGDEGIYYINGSVDAATGRVLSFSYSTDYRVASDSDKMLTESQAQAIVDKFLKANAPDELKKTKQDNISVPDAGQYYNKQYYYFNNIRYENDTPFRNNSISITLDAYSGKITGYSLTWYDNAEFPSVRNVLTPQKAMTAYVEQNGYDTEYITVGDGKAGLVYDFGSGGGYIDPFTGKSLLYTGEHAEDSEAAPDYSDIKGHWSESYVNRLLENGVYQWGGKFDPNRVMTQLEFLEYLMLLEPWYQAEPLTFFKEHGIELNIKADGKTPVTRQEAARIIAEYFGYGKLAVKSEWFAYPFTGAVDAAYKGYITICCMLGIITETGGNYNAKANVTRAEAAMLLHNVILAKSAG